MKLATCHDGSRDGQLVVVSRDLTLAHYASGVATRLQQVLDDWNFLSPQLEELSQTLNHGKARHAFAFDPALCMAPLPRAYQLAVGAAPGPDGAQTDPVMCQRAGDAFVGPRGDIVAANVESGIDFGAGLAVITGDVAIGTGPEAALEGIRLLMLSNDVSLRQPVPAALSTAFGPVAATPDELLHAWIGGRAHLKLESVRNGKRVGQCSAGDEMRFHFGELIAHLCQTRPVRAGSIVGSGALPVIAPQTDALRSGDTIRIEMTGLDGTSVFGAIEQRVVAPA